LITAAAVMRESRIWPARYALGFGERPIPSNNVNEIPGGNDGGSLKNKTPTRT
jgi:hypothetical protein